jgi:esterase/lipase superfamily enzyme
MPEEFRSTTAEILYITDRARQDTESRPVWYSYGRDKAMSFGTCEVEFGRGMSWDELDAASAGKKRTSDVPLWIDAVTELGRLPVSDGAGYRIVEGQEVEIPEYQSERLRIGQEFLANLSERVKRTRSGEVFMFVHGFNNDFADPMYVAAQIWHFAGRDMVPIVYTWPAGWDGFALFGYNYDRESGEFTTYHLKAALKTIAACPDVKKVHLIAHSRGTDVLMTALRELHIRYRAAGVSTREQLKLGSLILAAPDIDMEVFSQRIGAERLPTVPERFTVYVSHKDDAIGLSDWLFASKRRLGRLRYADLDDRQREVAKNFSELNVVDVTAHTSGLGHSYFYDCPCVLSDLILCLRGKAPGENTGRPLKLEGGPFWQLPEGYPGH